MNEQRQHYVLPPIPSTPQSRDGISAATSNIAFIASNRQQRQSKIPILYAPSKSVQEYLSGNGSVATPASTRYSENDMRGIYTSESGYPETPPHQPQYTDKWKFQFMAINKQLRHMSNRKLFTDPYFDITDLRNNLVPDETIVWMRPKDFVDKPVIGINTTNFRDVLQGRLDDCAFVAACDSLSKYPFLLKNIFQKDIELYGPNYNGCVKIRLWINDEWIWVCIDDRLPTVNGRPCYSHCTHPAHFWVALLEKAYAKLSGNYDNLVGIDSSTVLITLTGGVVLRLNPTIVNDRDNIYYYLNRAFEKRIMIAIAGAELVFNMDYKSGARTLKSRKREMKAEKRTGHAYALIDIIYVQKSKKYYIKLRNSQTNMKIFKEVQTEEDMKVLETITLFEDLNDPSQDNSDSLYFSYDEFFEYFETLNIIVILNDYLTGFDVSASGFWSLDCGLKLNGASDEDKIIDKYLKSPHFYFNLISKASSKGPLDYKPINFIVNLVTDLINENEFIGVVILPIREKPTENKENSMHFINYTIHRQTLCHVNPLCLEIKLLPGKYMIGLITQADVLPKRFSLRLATNTANASIMRLQELLKQQDSETFWLGPTNHPNSRPRLIKIILSKCCVCSCVLDESFITSGAKVFCVPCYNLTFRCDICNIKLGEVYYTLEQRLACENCLAAYTKSLNIVEAPNDASEANGNSLLAITDN